MKDHTFCRFSAQALAEESSALISLFLVLAFDDGLLSKASIFCAGSLFCIRLHAARPNYVAIRRVQAHAEPPPTVGRLPLLWPAGRQTFCICLELLTAEQNAGVLQWRRPRRTYTICSVVSHDCEFVVTVTD